MDPQQQSQQPRWGKRVLGLGSFLLTALGLLIQALFQILIQSPIQSLIKYRWGKRGLGLGGILVALLVVLLLIRIGYAHSWTGFGQSEVKEAVQPSKTLWDWLDLLIVPFVLAVGGYLFNWTETRRTQETADQQRTLDRQIADERRQDDMLQAYLDGMEQLLSDRDLPLHSAQPGDSQSTVARARTLTVLGRLDSGRKGSVLQFLFESGLIYRECALLDESNLLKRRHNIVRLNQADLTGADLSGANLNDADLSGADLIQADLSGANLRYATLTHTDLREADLSSAWLHMAISDPRCARAAIC